MNKHVTFLRAAAAWFRSEAVEATEDSAHWSRVYNADNCDKAAEEIERQAQEISRLQGLLTKLQLDGKPNRKQRRSAASR